MPNRIICRWCGADPSKESTAALRHTNKKGVIGIWECANGCKPKPDQRCQAGIDGDCFWPQCPQLVEYQTVCPLIKEDMEEES